MNENSNIIDKLTDENGYGINRTKVYYLGLRENPRKGVMTIATQVMDDGSLHIGVAYCSSKDHFKKSRGREIALGRLQKGGDYHYYVSKFSGNSANDFKRIFNIGMDDHDRRIIKPNPFRKWYIANPIGLGFTYCEISG